MTATATEGYKIADEWYGFINNLYGCVLMRGETEIDYFTDKKHAKAYMLHVYGFKYAHEAREHGLTIKPLKGRGPRAGDAVTYKGGGEKWSYLLKECKAINKPAVSEKLGILGHDYGRDTFGLCFDASAYRDGNHVSCSGGPIPCIKASSLTFIGLRRTRFWRFSNGYAEGGGGGDFFLNVPHWLWDGEAE